MIKFAPKKYKHTYLAVKKEKKIFVYKFILALAGEAVFHTIDAVV